MRIRPSHLCYFLLASLGANGAAAAGAASGVNAFPIDTTDLAAQICGENGQEGPKNTVECNVIVKNAPSTGGPGASVRLVSSELVVTPCGLWEATLTLAPIRLQPVTQKVLAETPEGSGRRVSAMILEMRTNLHLGNRATGRTADFALLPGSGPAGPWVLARTGTSSHPIHLAGESDVEPIVFEGCIPAWVFQDPDLEVDPETDCEVCPEDDPSDEETGGGGGDTSQAVPAGNGS